MKYSFDSQLEQHRLMLFNAKNTPTISKRLNALGYNGNKMLKGIALYDDVLHWQSVKNTHYGAQKTATDALQADCQEFKKPYTEHVALARIAFKEDRGTLSTLKVDEARKTSLGGWLTQASAFYSQLANYTEVMSRYGVSSETIQSAQSQLQALKTRRDAQLQRKGEAQDATEKRNLAMKALNNWMKEFRQIARIAMKDDPQLLETLGIVVKA
uniref:Uncharacterized protein n=1 Tax=Roseihalotalea indica TaxID=2867963 RepID=A0AA49GS41_9BACT|nr:hypothetical protein K4G66_01270 [Tunicatimonas sp. TK19036]